MPLVWPLMELTAGVLALEGILETEVGRRSGSCLRLLRVCPCLHEGPPRRHGRTQREVCRLSATAGLPGK